MKNRFSYLGALLILTLSLLLAACAAPTPAPAAVPPPAPSPTGELRIAVASITARSMDPIVDPAGAVTQLELVYDWLVGYDAVAKDVSTKTGLAERWERPDPTTWVFYLRDGVTFQNGAVVTAEDVKFSLERVISEKSRASYGSVLKGLITRMEVINPKQLLIRTKVPAFTLPFVLSPMTGLEGMVLPREYVEREGEKILATKPVGSGPYQVTEYQPGIRLVLEATREHFAIGTPKYSRIVWLEIPEETTRIAMLKRGDADVAYVSPESLPGVKDAGFDTRLKNESFVANIQFSQQWKKGSPLSDERVREALSLAINRQELVDSIMRGAADASVGNFMARNAIGFEPLVPVPYDPERAKRLLQDAGYARGLVINLYNYTREALPQSRTIADAIAGYWKNVGVDTKIIVLDYGAVRPLLANATLIDPAVAGPHDVGALVQYDSIFGLLFHSKGAIPLTKDAKLDSLIEELTTEGLKDKEGYALRASRVDRYLREHYVILPLFHGATSLAVTPKVAKWELGAAQFGINLRGLVAR